MLTLYTVSGRVFHHLHPFISASLLTCASEPRNPTRNEEDLLLLTAYPACTYSSTPWIEAYAAYFWRCDAPSGGRQLLIARRTK